MKDIVERYTCDICKKETENKQDIGSLEDIVKGIKQLTKIEVMSIHKTIGLNKHICGTCCNVIVKFHQIIK